MDNRIILNSRIKGCHCIGKIKRAMDNIDRDVELADSKDFDTIIFSALEMYDIISDLCEALKKEESDD